MEIVFRADASITIGTGHVMRCLTLADALRERGAHCRFICRSHPGNLLEALRQRGHAVDALPEGKDTGPDLEGLPTHAAWLGASWEEDAQATLCAIGSGPAEWLVVDHYALDARWERAVRGACRQLLVIDDLADRLHDCDVLLDQNLGRQGSAYAGRVPEHCTVLAGAAHALLRPDFAALRSRSLARREVAELRSILISMGGVDKDNATCAVLAALRGCMLPAECRITVVMGQHSPWLQEVREQAAGLPWGVEVRVNVQDMASLMAESDLAIGAAGTTAWERCSLGLPTLTVVLAQNQLPGARALAAAGAAWLLDLDGLAAQLRDAIVRLRQPGELLALARAAAAVTDGAGTNRLLEVMSHGEY